MLTVYGIETNRLLCRKPHETLQLQQCLPFTVLKLQKKYWIRLLGDLVATVLTVYGIETRGLFYQPHVLPYRCNSAYRLRY